jgi:hypothetical protein
MCFTEKIIHVKPITFNTTWFNTNGCAGRQRSAHVLAKKGHT